MRSHPVALGNDWPMRFTPTVDRILLRRQTFSACFVDYTFNFKTTKMKSVLLLIASVTMLSLVKGGCVTDKWKEMMEGDFEAVKRAITKDLFMDELSNEAFEKDIQSSKN